MLKFGLILVLFGRIKIGLVFGFCGCQCHFIGIGLVLVCHFPENDISSTEDSHGGQRIRVFGARQWRSTLFIPHVDFIFLNRFRFNLLHERIPEVRTGTKTSLWYRSRLPLYDREIPAEFRADVTRRYPTQPDPTRPVHWRYLTFHYRWSQFILVGSKQRTPQQPGLWVSAVKNPRRSLD